MLIKGPCGDDSDNNMVMICRMEGVVWVAKIMTTSEANVLQRLGFIEL